MKNADSVQSLVILKQYSRFRKIGMPSGILLRWLDNVKRIETGELCELCGTPLLEQGHSHSVEKSTINGDINKRLVSAPVKRIDTTPTSKFLVF